MSLDPDRMRRLDRWLGIPLCFALTIASRLAGRLGGPRAAPRPPRNVLFIELAEMGTTVLAAPAVHALRTAHADCQLYFLLFKQIADSVRVLRLVPDSHVLTIDASRPLALVRDTFRFLVRARRLKIDTSINLEAFSRYSTILAVLSGARQRVGFHRFTQEGLYTGDLLTHRVPYNAHQHTWQSILALVRAVDAPSHERPLGKHPRAAQSECVIPAFRSDPAVRARVLATLHRLAPATRGKRLVIINPNASRLISIRKWPLDRYAALVERLAVSPDVACVLTGVADEREDAQYIKARVASDRVVDFTGRTSLEELLCLFELADVLVTNDSGPAHFAALTPIQVVVFFGPETPDLYRPLTERCTVLYAGLSCSPCVSAFNQRRSPCDDNRCLQAISVDTVEAVVMDLLRNLEISKSGHLGI